MTDRPLMLLDSASMYFRAYYGVPESVTAPDGTPVNAVRGFVDMIARLVTERRPARLVACLDLDWRPAFRVEALPSYKAHRVEGATGAELPAGVPEEVPDGLAPQVPVILDVLAAAGIATGGAGGHEADDVIGTLAHGEETEPVLAVSGDRDLMQIVREQPTPVRLLYIGRGLNKAEHLGPAEVAAKYGVPLDRAGAAYAEMAMLRGDPSDGLPGVPGVGEKTAATLVGRFGTWDELEHVDPREFTVLTMPERLRTVGDPWEDFGADPGTIDELLGWWERDVNDGLGELPFPPDYPKMPGEPPRVQPSRKVAAHW